MMSLRSTLCVAFAARGGYHIVREILRTLVRDRQAYLLLRDYLRHVTATATTELDDLGFFQRWVFLKKIWFCKENGKLRAQNARL